MKIDIIKLKSGIIDSIRLDEKVKVDEELLKKSNIYDLKDTYVKGEITRDELSYNINAVLSGSMVLPCNITLEPTNYEFQTEIIGNIEELLEEIGENSKNYENILDIFPIIWENILMEIPMKVVNEKSQNIKLEGNGWKLITEDEEKLNPELQKLKELLK